MLIALGFLEWGKVLPVLIDSHLPPDRFSGGTSPLRWLESRSISALLYQRASDKRGIVVRRQPASYFPPPTADNNPDQQAGRENRVGEFLDDLIINTLNPNMVLGNDDILKGNRRQLIHHNLPFPFSKKLDL